MGAPSLESSRERRRSSDSRPHVLSDWSVRVDREFAKVGCTTITRAEVEDILAKMKALDPPSEKCWEDLGKAITHAEAMQAMALCLHNLHDTVRELQIFTGMNMQKK